MYEPTDVDFDDKTPAVYPDQGMKPELDSLPRDP